MPMVGADSEQLLAGVARMRNAADELDSHAIELSRTLGSVSWLGQIANNFVNMWNSGHKRNLGNTAKFIRDAAGRLEAQAHQQQAASRADGLPRFTITDGRVVAVPPAIVGTPGPGPVATPGVGPVGAVPGSNRTWQEVQRDYDANYAKYGLWADGGPNGENRYQCVSWAWYRMRELGYKGPQFSANGAGVAAGMHGTTATAPAPGAVMSYGTGFGHVVIAEEVVKLPDGRLRVRVSEMNTGNDPYVGRPEEYRADRWMEQNANGTWSSGGKNEGAVTTANPQYSK